MTRARRLRTLGAATAAVAALTLVPAATVVADTYRVRAMGPPFEWRPVERHLNRRDRVKWVNRTNVAHRIDAYGGNWTFSARLEVGSPVVKRFRRAGTFRYRCTLPGHSTLTNGECSGMCGSVLVH